MQIPSMSTQVTCFVSYRVKYVENLRYNVRKNQVNYTAYEESVVYRDYSACCNGNEQDRQCMYSETVRHVRATVVVEKQ
jgi:hypothetical protein